MAKKSRLTILSEYAFVRLALWVLQSLPMPLAAAMARGLGAAAWAVDARHRRRALANLDLAYGDEMTQADKRRLVRRVFQHLTTMIVEVAKAPRLITPETAPTYVEIDNGGTGKNHIQFYQGGLTLKAGKKYTLCVWAKSDGDRPVELCVQHHVNPWTSYTRKQVTFTDSWNEYTVTFDQPEDDTNARVNIYLGLSDIDVWIDHVRLYEGEYFDDEIRGKPEEQPVISQDRLIATWGKLKVR